MCSVIDAAKQAIPDTTTRKAFYKAMITAFECEDCDTLGDCYGQDPAFDAALKTAHPDWNWDYYDALPES